jgi:hypothetical protein
MGKQFRQGDVLLYRIDAIPPTAKPMRAHGDKVVLVWGEANHAHAVPATAAQLFEDGASGRCFLVVVGADARLQHEEHASIRLPSGLYEVIRQREYTPGAIRPAGD